MRIESHLRSISAELQVVKDRVRHMIDGRHWPSDGELKESVLRSVIRRSAPSSVSIGRGFVLTGSNPSSQIDILIHDNSHPVLYRDGDLVFVAPAACRAIIEVKSKLTGSNFSKAAQGLANTAQLIRGSRGGSRTFAGLFAYEVAGLRPERALDTVAAIADGNPHRVIDQIALGPSTLFKWWDFPPDDSSFEPRVWHAYNLALMSAGYFIHNLLMHLSPDAEQTNDGIWFPEQSEETKCIYSRRLSGA